MRHWTKEDYEAHEKMGFHKGWGIATDQLEALVARIYPALIAAAPREWG